MKTQFIFCRIIFLKIKMMQKIAQRDFCQSRTWHGTWLRIGPEDYGQDGITEDKSPKLS